MTMPALPALGSTSWLPWASAVHDRVTASAIINARTYGAVGDGTGDQTAAIQAAIDAAESTGGGVVYIPAGTYRTLGGIVHKSNVTVMGAGRAATIIHNQVGVSPTNYGDAIAWHFGTYGPGDWSTAIQNEAGWNLNAQAAGLSQVTLATAGNASNFAIGDYISYEGGTNGTGSSPRIPNGVACVVGKSSGTLYLDRVVPVALATDAAAPVVRKLNTGALSFSPHIDVAFLLHDAVLRDLTVKGDSEFPPLNLACIDSVIQDVDTIGWTSLNGNPVAGSSFIRVHGKYRHGALEFAYMSHDNYLTECRWRRHETDTSLTGSIGVWINTGEGARDTHFTDCELVDVTTETSTSTHFALELGDRCTWTGGRVLASRAGGVAMYSPEAALIEATVTTTAADAIQIGGSRVQVLRNHVGGTPPNKAILVSVSALDAIVEDNILGVSGSRTAAHVVSDVGTRTHKSGNVTYVSPETVVPIYTTELVSTNGIQAEYDIAAITVVAGSVNAPGQAFRFHVSGSAAGSGTKTIRVKLNTVTALSITPASGAWSLSGTIAPGNFGSLWVYDVQTFVGGVSSRQIGGATLTLSSFTKFSVTGQSTAADDGIDRYFRDVSFTTDASSTV